MEWNNESLFNVQITIIGTGYVGLVSGACFARLGWTTCCVDKNPEKIQTLQKGDIPFYEPGLKELVQEGIAKNKLSFTSSFSKGISQADLIFIAVGTPSTQEGGADLSAVFNVAEQMAPFLRQNTIIVTKSTVPVGTGAKITEKIRQRNAKAVFHVASNPEFLREGCAIEDFMAPDRIVVGTNHPFVTHKMQELYAPLIQKGAPLIVANLETAELIKYASNAFLALKVAFINEIADLCEQVNADVEAVAQGIGQDSRIGAKFLKVGPGYGGSCFPKDTLALVHTAEEVQSPLTLIQTVVQSNINRKQRMAHKIIQACGGDLRGKTLAILGITFKANTDDLRESPSLTILPLLQKAGAQLRIYDPQGMKEGKKTFSSQQITWCKDPLEAAYAADGLVILTEWDVFKSLDFSLLKHVLKQPLLIDLRNLYDPKEVASIGFQYVSVGRPLLAETSADSPAVEAA